MGNFQIREIRGFDDVAVGTSQLATSNANGSYDFSIALRDKTSGIADGADRQKILEKAAELAK